MNFLTSVSFEFHHPNNMQVKKRSYNEIKPSMSLTFQRMKLCSKGDEQAIFAFLKTRCLYILNSLRNLEYGDISIQQQHEKTTISSF